ncbi:hypothetical protein FVEG_15154 [Fusarium verticillioides 7600]|uniref:Uncharacterized protein n=1 Tax=Gibberella moniliformis (strain M3125 / FGSC 7600) TaxID=334819 RepID=W7M6R8_GIBM7|nr:hypothetical protein FVEG_15154 [Fusarium verticillioides 7600]EWG40602.1 hypothetical protein FVEG_15154 [Fusarium verticillioides 7600]
MSQRLALIVSGIPRAIINFGPGLRTAFGRNALNCTFVHHHVAPDLFGLVFGSYPSLPPSMTIMDWQQLSYGSSNTTTVFMALRLLDLSRRLSAPSQTHLWHHLYGMDPGSLQPETRHRFHRVLFCDHHEGHTEQQRCLEAR